MHNLKPQTQEQINKAKNKLISFSVVALITTLFIAVGNIVYYILFEKTFFLILSLITPLIIIRHLTVKLDNYNPINTEDYLALVNQAENYDNVKHFLNSVKKTNRKINVNEHNQLRKIIHSIVVKKDLDNGIIDERTC
jgi:hypothetical protein